MHELRRFILRWIPERYGQRFIASELGNPPAAPSTTSVQLPLAHFISFRNSYLLLLAFAAQECGRPISKLTGEDIAFHLRHKSLDRLLNNLNHAAH